MFGLVHALRVLAEPRSHVLYKSTLRETIADSEFVLQECGFSSISGPAAVLTATSAHITILETGFFKCTGCALDITAPTINITRCCAESCSSFTKFIATGDITVQDTFCLHCTDSSNSIAKITTTRNLRMQFCNFTGSKCAATWLISIDAGTESYVQHFAAVLNSAKILFREGSSSGSHYVDHSKFVKNMGDALIAAGAMASVGLAVTSSGFFGDQNKVFVAHSSRTVPFNACVFSETAKEAAAKAGKANIDEETARFGAGEGALPIRAAASHKCWDLIGGMRGSGGTVVIVIVVLAIAGAAVGVYCRACSAGRADTAPLMYV
jgi:hypothetical protein